MCDARHAKRLAVLLTRLGAQPIRSIPSACHGWTETVAAYRFLDNPHVGFEEILSGHKQATLERIHAQEVALLGKRLISDAIDGGDRGQSGADAPRSAVSTSAA